MEKTLIDGAALLAKFLESKGVTTVFCITGAGNLAVVNAIKEYTNIEMIFSHHEQAAVMEAQGYSRVSGNPGVALVTTGGGASNTVTGVLSAHLDSIPVFLISGNESSFHCINMSEFRAYGVQGFDAVSVLKPVTKFSKRIMNSSQENILNEAWEVMTSDRPGPVHIDFPMDLQRTKFPAGLDFLKNNTNKPSMAASHDLDISDLMSELMISKKPLFYLGNGARNNGAVNKFLSFCEKFNIPFAVSWSAIDLVPDNHPLNIGRIGIYGHRHANLALQNADLFVSVGSRLAIPQIGYDKEDFCRNARKYVVDIDPVELSKFQGKNWSIKLSSASNFFDKLNLETFSEFEPDFDKNWLANVATLKNALPLAKQIGDAVDESKFVHSYKVIDILSNITKNNSTIVTDVGAALLTGHYAYRVKDGQRFFTSQGLGEMGFGLPAAIGAFFADRTRPIICLNTDGAIMFNLQELQVAKHHRIPLKLFIFNNGGYAMIKISQGNLFNSNYIGSDIDTGISFPDFAEIASTFGFNYRQILGTNGAESQIAEALDSENPELIDVIMDPSQKYFPRLATSKKADGTLVSPPIEDLDPKLPISLFSELLGYAPLPTSIEARDSNAN